MAPTAHRSPSRPPASRYLGTLAVGLLALSRITADDDVEAPLPPEVRVVWDLDRAARESTPTRERICLNGLWRWQPAVPSADTVPSERWGYFKVPGAWPGITDYQQKDCQTVFPHPAWSASRLSQIKAAWYQRTFAVPREWSGRRIALRADYVNSLARVFVDGRLVGDLRFPGGELDLATHCRPGQTSVLSVLAIALPLQSVLQSYANSAEVRDVEGSVARRGLCGDVFLVSTPSALRIAGVGIEPSFRKHSIAVRVSLEGSTASAPCVLKVRFRPPQGPDQAHASPPFSPATLESGIVRFEVPWAPDRLWDLHTPQHQCTAEISLHDAADRLVDASHPVRFGFREFWIDGRDFRLNGSRLHLSAVPLDNAQVGAAWSTYAAARESLERLQRFGINYVYTHNYGCEPGSHLGFEDILRAADDVGMLVGFSLPHFSHYAWTATNADTANGYRNHAAYYIDQARNHPSVVLYSMSHNATGYSEDMNPDQIDGRQGDRDAWALKNARLARRAEAIANQLDPGRPVYHHAGGNLGTLHTSNFYPNFVPIQELSDWFEHWATDGIKPLFTCEYAAPFSWDWTLYRGWYEGQREFGSARVPWEFCLAEWNAQFLGDAAYPASPAEQENLRWEARHLAAGDRWHRWDYPHAVGSDVFDERYPIYARYFARNWPAFRTWGVSAISPWDHGHFWKLRPGVRRGRTALPVDWEHLQRPGFSPDYLDQRYERMDLAYERSDWIPTAAAQALLRFNRPLLAWLAGKPGAFTSQDHNFLPGQPVEKQIVLINDSRRTVTAQCEWLCQLPQTVSGRFDVSLPAGEQHRRPIAVPLPTTLPPGTYRLEMRARFDTGEVQEDACALHIVPAPTRDASARSRIALFDPRGHTRALLERLGIRYEPVSLDTQVAPYDLLLIGREALTLDGPAPSVQGIRQGQRVVLFEQSAAVLEQRLGFRVQAYGLRQLFPRVPDHPILAGIPTEGWSDWRGAATLLPPRLDYTLRPQHGPTVSWCGLPVSRAWRCGNRGNVASVLLEKPARGDFLPLLDGGFSLQYSPLLECREGRGLLLFCQLDVSGRTEPDPVADQAVHNLLAYAANWQPQPARQAVYSGALAGADYLRTLGIPITPFQGTDWPTNALLILGPGGSPDPIAAAPAVARGLQAGQAVLALGLDETSAPTTLPHTVQILRDEHLSTGFPAPRLSSPFAGIGPADVHNRDPRPLPLVRQDDWALGNGVLAADPARPLVLCQLLPWEFNVDGPAHLRRTHRRAAYTLTRLLANLGVAGGTPILERLQTPVGNGPGERRWLEGLYRGAPHEWDDPYRFFRW